MSTKEDAKKRGIFLKKLREEHQETVAATQALLKEQQAVRREICRHMREEPRAIPELAEMAQLPTGEVLWHVTAMKKYGLVVETGMCGEYYLYQLTK
jgi:predicted transcriptional regulator